MNTEDTIRSRTIASIPGFAEAIKRSRNAHSTAIRSTKQPRFEQAVAEMNSKIISLLEQGKTIPDDIADDVAQAERDDRSLQIRAAAIRENTRTVPQVNSQYFAEGASTAFDHLQGELDGIIDAVKQLDSSLAGIADPAAAIAAGLDASDAWRKLGDLVDEYDQVREMQFEILRQCTSHPKEQLTRVALLRDSLDAHPYYVARRHDAANRSAQQTPEGKAFAAWLREARTDLTLDDGNWWPATTTREEHLLTLARSHQPWVPDVDQLEAALTAAGRATQELTLDQPRHQLEARATYYRVTGAETAIDVNEDFTPSPAEKARLDKARLRQQMKVDRLRSQAESAAHDRIQRDAWDASHD